MPTNQQERIAIIRDSHWASDYPEAAKALIAEIESGALDQVASTQEQVGRTIEAWQPVPESNSLIRD